jgi:Tfp pilus assembly protein PilE
MSLYGKEYFSNKDEVVNEFSLVELIIVIVAAYFALLVAIAGYFGSAARKNKKIADAFMNDSATKEKLKNFFDNMQKFIFDAKGLSKYKKYFIKKNFDINSKSKKFTFIKSKSDTVAVINLPIIKIDVEKIFKDIYKTDMASYTEEYLDDQPDNDKPAPEFKKFMEDMEKDIIEEFKPIKDKLKNVSISLHYREEETPYSLDVYYYDLFILEKNECNIQVSIKLSKSDIEKKNIPTTEEEK